MRLLLDTVAFIVAAKSPETLPNKVQRMLDAVGEHSFQVSAISLTEIAVKHSAGKLDMDEATAQAMVADLDLSVLPYSAEHVYRLFRLPLHHRDPFDRMLIAQALVENVPILTSDEQFLKYKGLKVIWK